MNKTLFLPMIILFFIFYYLMFPMAGSSEIFWAASELHDFSRLDQSPDSLEEVISINQGRFQGVLLPHGGNVYLLKGEEEAAVSGSFFIFKSDNSFILENLKDETRVRIPFKEYPLILSDHFYSADFSSAILEEFDPSGVSLWRWRGTSPITAIDAGRSCTVFGSVDGRVRLFSRQGEMTELLPADLEEDNVVYGLALSLDCSRLAVVSGLNKQYIRQYLLKENGPPELIHEQLLDSRYPRPVKLYYSESAFTLWVEQDDSLLQFRGVGMGRTLPLDGTLMTQDSDEESGLIYVLSRLIPSNFSEKSYQLAVYAMDGSVIMKNRFDEYPEFFYRTGRDIYLSMDERLLVIKRLES
jgi:hypothetical protein